MDPLPHEPSGRITLCQARVPACLLAPAADLPGPDRDGLSLLDLVLEDGRLASVAAHDPAAEGPGRVPLQGRMVWPCPVDMHTHLDKGQIWPRAANPDGSFAGALDAVGARPRGALDAPTTSRARMEFAPALRLRPRHRARSAPTSIPSPPQHGISWPVFADMRERWAGRIELQAVCAGRASTCCRDDDCAGDLAPRRRRARRRPRRCHLHGARNSTRTLDRCLRARRRARPRPRPPRRRDRRPRRQGAAPHRRGGAAQPLPGPRRSPAIAARSRVQRPRRGRRTIDRVAEAGIAVVSLPMCNLYLQDRQRRPHAALARRHAAPRDAGPRHPGRLRLRQHPRPVLRLRRPRHARGLPRGASASSSSTTRSAAGPRCVAATPAADHAACADGGLIAPGAPADLVLFTRRTWTELLARPQSDRIVLRGGQADRHARCPTTRELDDLMGARPMAAIDDAAPRPRRRPDRGQSGDRASRRAATSSGTRRSSSASSTTSPPSSSSRPQTRPRSIRVLARLPSGTACR